MTFSFTCIHPSVCKWGKATALCCFVFSPSRITGSVGWKVDSMEQVMPLLEDAGEERKAVREMFLSK